jgi:hypothetical protein
MIACMYQGDFNVAFWYACEVCKHTVEYLLYFRSEECTLYICIVLLFITYVIIHIVGTQHRFLLVTLSKRYGCQLVMGLKIRHEPQRAFLQPYIYDHIAPPAPPPIPDPN